MNQPEEDNPLLFGAIFFLVLALLGLVYLFVR